MSYFLFLFHYMLELYFLLVVKIMLDLIEVLDFGLDCVMFLSKVVFCLFCYAFCNEFLKS